VNLLLLDQAEIDASGKARVRARRAEHLSRVLRVSMGDQVRVGVIGGPTGTATVARVVDDCVELQVRLLDPAPAPPHVELILAVPRPKALSRVVQQVSALGVRRIDLVNAWRVEKSYLDSPRLDPPALREQAVLGCEQGATTWVPEIAVHRLLLPFLRERIGPRPEGSPSERRLVAHPDATRYVEETARNLSAGTTLVAVGPEGGWTAEELASFTELGFVPVKLGRGVLRVETAVTALLAQLELCERAFGQN
jgi:16S rRNA (uracil1498-N3)-methyltransferase